MSLISRLLQEIREEEKREGELQCFIGHEFRHKDLRVKLECALERLGLQAYFADREVTGEYILDKVCKKILVTRASIVDLTTANPNVYFEFGVAIGLNKPVFVVLKRGATVPPLLDSFVKLRFTSYAGLERELSEQVPGWLEQSIEHHLLYNTHCHFVNVLCPDRQRLTFQRRYLVIDQMEGTNEEGQTILTDDPDLRAELSAALDRFHFDPVFLGDVPLQDTFRLCDYCRALRDSSFALCHLTWRTSPNVYLLLGLVTGLDIPSLLVVHEERDKRGRLLFEIPTMLRGLDAFYYEYPSVDIPERLGNEVEGFLNRHKGRPISSKVLVFPDLIRRNFFVEEVAAGSVEKKAQLGNLPPKPYRELIARDSELEEIMAALRDPVARWIAAIHGEGGIGKTALSHEVADRCLTERLFDTVVWESAYERELTFETVIDTIAQQLGRADILRLKAEEKEGQVMALLQGQRLLASGLNSTLTIA